MIAINHPYDGGRPLLPLAIGVSRPMVFGLANNGRRVPKPIDCRFLIDTGADDTYVDRLVLDQLRLFPVNSVAVQTGIPGSSPVPFDQYEIKLRIPSATLGQPDFVVESMPVLCGDFSMQAIDGLIGRDVLTYCVASFDGKGSRFTLTF